MTGRHPDEAQRVLSEFVKWIFILSILSSHNAILMLEQQLGDQLANYMLPIVVQVLGPP